MVRVRRHQRLLPVVRGALNIGPAFTARAHGYTVQLLAAQIDIAEFLSIFIDSPDDIQGLPLEARGRVQGSIPRRMWPLLLVAPALLWLLERHGKRLVVAPVEF